MFSGFMGGVLEAMVKKYTMIEVRQLGRMKRIKIQHSNIAGLSPLERKVMSYEQY